MTCSSTVNARAQLFKTNDLVSKRFVKISNLDILNLPIFFVVCTAKASLILSTKNINVFGYKVIKHLTS